MTTTETDETIIDYTPTDKKRGRGLIWFAFLLTWGLLGFGYITITQSQTAASNTSDLKIVEQKLASLATSQERMAQQEQIIARHSQTLEGLSDSLEAVDLLQQAVTEIPKQMQTEDKSKADKESVIKLASLVQTIGTRMTDAEDTLHKINSQLKQKEAFNTETYTLLKLRDRVSRGEDFHIELDLLKRMTANDPTMQENLIELSNILQDSSLSLPTLREDFAEMIGTIKQAVKKAKQVAAAEQEKSIWDNVTASLSGQIKVKKLNDEASDPTAQTIAKVQKALRHGDVNSAIKASGEFTGAAAKAAEAWRTQLKELNTVQQLFERIYDYARNKSAREAAKITPAAGKNSDTNLGTSLVDALDNSLLAQ